MEDMILPERVDCKHQPDGGAVVSAGYGYGLLYCRAFDDLEKARAEAAALFTRPFKKPEHSEEEW